MKKQINLFGLTYSDKVLDFLLDCSNFRINSDKYPAAYGVNFYDSEVISVFNFVVGYLRVMRLVRPAKT